MIGRVVSAKMQKTVSVLVEGKKTHPLYKKTFVWSKKYLVHDEMGAKEGDVVVIEETRPISKRVHWKIARIIGADVVALGEAAMKQVEQEAIEEVMPEEKEEVESSVFSDQPSAGTGEPKKAKTKEPKAKTEKVAKKGKKSDS
jgi:small subunit ribosomal protein S17